jgi:hypothetical protein
MSRDELVEATYDAAEALNGLKLKYGRIDRQRGQEVADRIRRARNLKARLDALDEDEEPHPDILQVLQGEIYAFSVSTACDKRELFWRRHVVNFKPFGIGRSVMAYAGEVVRQLFSLR